MKGEMMMGNNMNEYESVLRNKKIPILSLDNKWHQLFTQTNVTPKIKRLDKKINELLKQQGKLTNECKKIKVAKKKLMDDILQLRSELEKTPSGALEAKLSQKTKLLNECNGKLETNQGNLMSIPDQINELNYQLMLETMEVCYKVLKKNSAKNLEITNWINGIKDELKEKVIARRTCERMSQDMYSYMHDIFGAEVIELFDMKYRNEDS